MGYTKLINNTNKVMAACEFRGMFTGEVNVMGTANAKGHINIDKTKYSRNELKVMIFCDGISLLKSSEQDLVLRGEEFFHFKTVTIDQVQVPGDSTGVVNYVVKFEPQGTPLKVLRHLDVDHDNGWSVQHSVNGIVKLTREEGMTTTLDPSKLFAPNIVHDPPETLLLNVFLKFWPRTFADLSCKDDLGTTIRNVNYLMRQANFHHANESNNVEVDKVVVQKVYDLHKWCAAMVKWYRPLFPNIQFPQVAEQMAEVDQGKLERFVAYIKPLLPKPPGSSS
ncbi:hypothetical protein RHGRI_005446 [Rhododendron griersonianum]|uniref:Uncharacterized protein n=1 Tax=Rhododendron griersonianum TaxID=479676 RepID=A0AAV6LCL9_9ERIC|nr:hypothetical protein RHGRI_005446 [Rhododendron griersonianum]